MADTKQGLVKSPFTIEKNADGVTYLSADLTAVAEWKQILSYSVPLGMAIEITPANYIFGEYYTTAGATAGNIISAGLSRVLKKNANGTESREIWSGSNKIFGDLGDELKRPKLKVPVVVNASQKIAVEVYGMGVDLDVSTSNFFIEATQYYEEI